jgi:hypothetical protein
MAVMREDLIAPPAYVVALGEALAEHYDDRAFTRAQTMGDLVWTSLELLQRGAEPASLKLLSGSTAADVARDVA